MKVQTGRLLLPNPMQSSPLPTRGKEPRTPHFTTLHHTMRFADTTEILAKRAPKYCRISECTLMQLSCAAIRQIIFQGVRVQRLNKMGTHWQTFSSLSSASCGQVLCAAHDISSCASCKAVCDTEGLQGPSAQASCLPCWQPAGTSMTLLYSSI